jgi:hypothetical protein
MKLGRKPKYLTQEEREDSYRRKSARCYWRRVAKKKRLEGNETGALEAERKEKELL